MTLLQRTHTSSILYLAFIAISLVTVVYSRSSTATPTISWTPSSLAAKIIAGQSTTQSATFTSSENASNVTFRVVPELAPYMKVSPATFSSVTKGELYTVQVTFAPAATATPDTHKGTIQIRQGTTTLAKPLPAQIHVVWPTFTESQNLGLSIQYPPDWYLTQEKNNAEFRNIKEPGELSEFTLQNESFFRVNLRLNDNPLGLPINQWFDQSVRPTISETLISEQNHIIDGHDAIYIEMSEVGGRRAHIFVFRNTDVVEITYGLFVPQFIADYEAMVQSLKFAQ